MTGKIEKATILKKLKNNPISIYADTDLDGLASVVFILAALGYKEIDSNLLNIKFLNNNAQSKDYFYDNKKTIKQDQNIKIVCDLGYVNGIDLWFDHHERSPIPDEYTGLYDSKSPSSVSLVYQYFKEEIDTHSLKRSFRDLKMITDKFDSGNLLLDQVVKPTDTDLLASVCEIEGEDEVRKLYHELINMFLSKELNEIIQSDIVQNRIAVVKERYEKHLKRIFDPKNIVHLNPEGIIILWIKGPKFKVNSFLPLYRYKKFQMTCFLFGREDDVDVRVYANPVYRETFDPQVQGQYRDYDLSQLPKHHGGGGHRGAGGFRINKEQATKLVDTLKQIDKLNTWTKKQEALNKIEL